MSESPDEELELEAVALELEEEEQAEGVPLWAKALVVLLVLVAVGGVIFYKLVIEKEQEAAAATQSGGGGGAGGQVPATTTSTEIVSLCSGGSGGSGGNRTEMQQDGEGCDRIVSYDSVARRCPLGWTPQRRRDGTMCCRYTPELFNKRDEAVRGSKAFVIGVNIGAGLATEMALPWMMKKALARLAAKGMKIGTKVVNKMMMSGSRLLIKVATAAMKMATKAAVAGAQIAAKAAAGPPGWVLIIFQLLTILLDFWDPMNYNAFEANRIFIGARNTVVTSFHSSMLDGGMEPPFIFPLALAFQKEFEAAYTDVVMKATSNYLLTLCEDDQTLWWSAMFTDEADMTALERRVLDRINREMQSAVSDMDPKVRDRELYKRMCMLVGKDNLWFDETFSTASRIAVSVSAEWARTYNERLGFIYETDTSAGNRFMPLISFSKYWYVPDGSQTVEVLLSLGNVQQWIGDAIGALSESAGEAIAPVATVPVMKRMESPSGRAIPQYNLMGQFRYNTCMGKRECDKVVLSGPLCDATLESDLQYSNYGVGFDDDKLICQYTCRLCERFGLRFTDFDDPSITNVPNASISDCEMYPGQDFLEMILGTTLTRFLVHAMQWVSKAINFIKNLAITAYNEMCEAMEPGSGGFCPRNCNDPSACAPETCRNGCKNNIVSRSICDGLDWYCINECKLGVTINYGWCKACFWCRNCERERDDGYRRCEQEECAKMCRTITEYTIDQACYGLCVGGCHLAQLPGICQARQGICEVVGGLCDWIGRDIPLIPMDCSSLH